MPFFPGPPDLRDGELELRRLLPADREAILAACQDPEILRWTALPDPFTADSARGLVEEAARAWDDGTVAELALVVDGRLVGATHLAFYSDWRASVAYWLAPEARGRGLATRAVRLVTRWGSKPSKGSSGSSSGASWATRRPTPSRAAWASPRRGCCGRGSRSEASTATCAASRSSAATSDASAAPERRLAVARRSRLSA